MPKKIIFDVGHPAQIHHFKNLYWLLEKKGWECLFVAKNKDISKSLLDNYKLKYKMLSQNRKGLLRKIFGIPVDDYRFLKIVNSFKPDFILNRFSIHSGHISKLKNIVNIAFSDTEHASMIHTAAKPFIDVKFTGNSYYATLGKNHLKYNSNTELFYLHPNIFKPDMSILKFLGVKENEKYVIIRFVSWDAHHDIGQEGFSMRFKNKMIEELTKYAKVFITSEGILPPHLEPYKIKIPPERIHDAMAFADLYIGEGGTMASESACLGTPSIYVNSLDAGVFHEEEAFGLLHNFRTSEGVLEKALEVLKNENTNEVYKDRLKEFLSKKIDVIKFMEWFLDNYPKSLDTIKNNPDYQYNFK